MKEAELRLELVRLAVGILNGHAIYRDNPLTSIKDIADSLYDWIMLTHGIENDSSAVHTSN